MYTDVYICKWLSLNEHSSEIPRAFAYDIVETNLWVDSKTNLDKRLQLKKGKG